MNKCLKCDSPVKARGLCNRHYKIERANGGFVPIKIMRGTSGSERLVARSKATESGCIVWTGSTDKCGYGRIWANGRLESAHRASYEAHIGKIPEGLCVLHRCDNPPCINPSHLFLGTPLDNSNDKIAKGRNRKAAGERHWKAKLTYLQVEAIRNESGVQDLIAKKYGVSQATVSRIKIGKGWIHELTE